MYWWGKRVVKVEGEGEGVVQPLEEESRTTAWLRMQDFKMAVTCEDKGLKDGGGERRRGLRAEGGGRLRFSGESEKEGLSRVRG